MHRGTPAPVWLIVLNSALTLAVTVLGIQVWRLSTHGLPRLPLQALQIVTKQIEAEHVAPPGDEELIWSAVEGMVRGLDDYSEFVRPTQVGQFEEATTGNYDGIGLVVEAHRGEVFAVFPFAGGPAELAGVQVGDRIVAIDAQPPAAASDLELLDQARQRLVGPAGSHVVLTLAREGQPALDLTVARGTVQKASVKWARILEPDAKIGYLQIQTFQSQTTQDLDAALAELNQACGGLRGLIVDLRFNPGGLLDEAIAVTNRFVQQGLIVTLKKRGIQVVQEHHAQAENCTYPELPLVVLINQNSASASEVMAGALQDHQRARLVGTRSFGKGLVQSIYRWKNLPFRLKLTTSHYYTPSGRSIEGHHRRAEDGDATGGIEPDRTATVDKPQNVRIRRGLDGEQPPPRYRAAVAALWQQLGVSDRVPLGVDQDPQLAAALDEARRLAAAWSSTK